MLVLLDNVVKRAGGETTLLRGCDVVALVFDTVLFRTGAHCIVSDFTHCRFFALRISTTAMDPHSTDSIPAGQAASDYLRLAAWQAERLAATYADLRADPRYAPATAFFLNDLYGARDYSRRDQDGERVIHKMRKLLPAWAIEALERALHLNRLTKALDEAMANMLFVQMGVEVIDGDGYCEAYRRCGDVAAREEQIRLIGELGQELDVVVQKPLVKMALKMAHAPAHMAGFGELQDFLERGVAAFLHMQGADQFLATITRREHRILAAIYASAVNPFDCAED